MYEAFFALFIMVLLFNFLFYHSTDTYFRANRKYTQALTESLWNKRNERTIAVYKQHDTEKQHLKSNVVGEKSMDTTLKQDGEQITSLADSEIKGKREKQISKTKEEILHKGEKNKRSSAKPKTEEKKEYLEQSKSDSDNSIYRIGKNKDGFERIATEKFVNRSNLCPPNSLYTTQLDDVSYGACTPHRPADYACKLTKELYYLDSGLKTCALKGDGNICDIEVKEKRQGPGNEVAFRVVCNRTLCFESPSGKRHFVAVAFDPDQGILRRSQRFKTFKQFQTSLEDIIRETIAHKIHFLFLKCKKRNGKFASQLMAIDPRLFIETSEKSRPKEALNVNILLLDSVARAHFYRSLPETINTFKSWGRSRENAPAKIFDFELFQAVEGHTAENTHVLFTGKPLPSNENGNVGPVEMEVMFGNFKKSGYQTMWQEDLCYKELWGLMSDVGVEDWESLQTVLQDKYIDNTGQ